MNLEDLQSDWNQIHRSGLKSHEDKDIEQLIARGSSTVVARLNKKLFRDMTITAIAVTISALGVIFFYFVYDPINHPSINLNKIIPVQLLGFILFLVLFLLGWREYRIINQKYPAIPLKEAIATLLSNFKKHNKRFMLVILSLLAVTYWLELNFFIEGSEFPRLMLKFAVTSTLTFLSYFVLKRYYDKSYGPYLSDLSNLHKELDE